MQKRKTTGRRMTHSSDKERVRTWARKNGRKVLWLDDRGIWHGATDRRNTPNWALETEEVDHV